MDFGKYKRYTSVKLRVALSSFRYKESSAVGPIFIVGTGRSGTHFLARSLITHPKISDIVGGYENPYVFKDVLDIAVRRGEGVSKLIRKYSGLNNSVYPKIFLDQSHPNLWLVEELRSNFPESFFVAIIRDPLSVIYSTLRHGGVKKWLEKGEGRYSRKFLGINENNEHRYNSFTIEERAALRWASHLVRIDELEKKLDKNLYVLKYEELCVNPQSELNKISALFQVDNLFEMPKIRMESLTKKSGLSELQVEQIKDTIRKYLESVELSEKTLNLIASYEI